MKTCKLNIFHLQPMIAMYSTMNKSFVSLKDSLIDEINDALFVNKTLLMQEFNNMPNIKKR